MFAFLKLKTPKEQAEYNKEKIINKNVENIIIFYGNKINEMIKDGLIYENYTYLSFQCKYNINRFRQKSIERTLIQLNKKYSGCGIIFKITWTGCENSYIGISIEFI